MLLFANNLPRVRMACSLAFTTTSLFPSSSRGRFTYSRERTKAKYSTVPTFLINASVILAKYEYCSSDDYAREYIY